MRKKAIKLFSLLTATALICAAFAGCAKKDDDSIKIGVMVPTSGPQAYYGNDMYQSYKLACDEINAAGGVLGRQLSLYLADDACDSNVATQAASKIISENADFVVGGYCSGSTIPALQLYADANLLMLVSAANSTEITEKGLKQTFMLNSPGTHAVSTLVDLCKSLGTKKVALIHQGDAYTKNLSDLCTKTLPGEGMEIVTTQIMESGAADVSAIVTAIKNVGADFVYWCGYHADGSNVIKQLRQGGYEGDIAVGDGSASVELITACGTAGENVYITSPPFVEFSKGADKFIAAYKEKYNVEPGNYAGLCYDTIYVLKEAIEKTNTIETDKVREAVQNISYDGLSGLIKFTADRELEVSNFIVLQIKNGKFELVNLQS